MSSVDPSCIPSFSLLFLFHDSPVCHIRCDNRGSREFMLVIITADALQLFWVLCEEIECIHVLPLKQVAQTLIKADAPWSARRGNLSEVDRVLKTVKG